MTREEAVNVMAQVCSKFVGTAADHHAVAEAFNLLTTEPEPADEPT